MKLDPALRERLERIKRRESRSLGWLIERCIEAHLPSLEGQVVHDQPGPVPPPPAIVPTAPVHYRRKPRAKNDCQA